MGLKMPFDLTSIGKHEVVADHNAPTGSMYRRFTHIWLSFMVNVGKHTIHGSYE